MAKFIEAEGDPIGADHNTAPDLCCRLKKPVELKPAMICPFPETIVCVVFARRQEGALNQLRFASGLHGKPAGSFLDRS